PDPGADPRPDYNFQFVSVLVYLLPYIEQGNVADVMRADLPPDYLNPTSVYKAWWNYPSAVNAAQTKIKTFVCPSDDPYEATGIADVILHPVRLSSTDWELIRDGFSTAAPPASQFGRTNYLGVSGFSGLIRIPANDGLVGPLYNRSGVKIS